MRDMALISNLKAAFEQDSQDLQDFQDYRIRSMTVALYPTIVHDVIGLQGGICNCKLNCHPKFLAYPANPARVPNHNQMQGDRP